jgi:hypothetical protein
MGVFMTERSGFYPSVTLLGLSPLTSLALTRLKR